MRVYIGSYNYLYIVGTSNLAICVAIKGVSFRSMMAKRCRVYRSNYCSIFFFLLDGAVQGTEGMCNKMGYR